MKKLALILTLLLWNCKYALAQDVTAQSLQEDLLEYFFLNNEQASEADGQVFLEQVEYLGRNPMDINKASFQELTASQLISPTQAQNLVAYRNALGSLLAIYELQAVPGWSVEDIKRVAPFVKVGSTSTESIRTGLTHLLRNGKKDFLLRYTPASATLPGNVEGLPHGYTFRFRTQIQGRMRFGLMAENDPGEAFFRGSNKQGFDNYNYYFYLKNGPGRRLRQLALGHYQVRLGQGLLLFSGLAFGKSPNTTLVLRSADPLGPFTSIAEGVSMRGVGATLQLTKRLEGTVFASHALRDAKLRIATDTLLGGAEEVFSSLQFSGLHRTPTEIENEKTVTETALGTSVKWSDARSEIAAQGLLYHFNRPWRVSEELYRKFVFTGQTLVAGSMSYRTVYRNILPFGEMALSQNGALAATNGFIVSTDRKATVAILHRYLSPRYQNINAFPFADGSSGNNEHGLYMGVELRPRYGFMINAYADIWRNPWLRFSADLPTSGHDVLLRITYSKRRSYTSYLQLQRKTRNQNIPTALDADGEGLIGAQRTGLRMHLEQQISPLLTMRSRLEYAWFTYRGFARTSGYLAYTEAVLKRSLQSPIQCTARVAYFNTETTQNAIYAYEQDVAAAFSVIPVSGQGTRAYLNLRWFISRSMTLEGRIANTHLLKTVSTSQQLGNRFFYRVQLKIDW